MECVYRREGGRGQSWRSLVNRGINVRVTCGTIVDGHVRMAKTWGKTRLCCLDTDEGFVEFPRVAAYGRLCLVIMMVLLVIMGDWGFDAVGEHHIRHQLTLFESVIR